MNRAIGYIRVSSEQQAKEGLSLEWQKAKIEVYCDFQNITLVDVVVEKEAVSGSVSLNKRVGGVKLLTAIKRTKPTHIIAYSLSRLFRNAVDGLTHIRNWDKQDIGLCLLDVGGQTINTRSAMGKMFMSMMLSFSELERNLTSERVRETHRHKKNKLEVYGSTPLGFDRQDMNLIENKKEIKTVRKMFELRKSGFSYNKIAEYLNTRNIKGKTGSSFYSCGVRHILLNDIYKQASIA